MAYQLYCDSVPTNVFLYEYSGPPINYGEAGKIYFNTINGTKFTYEWHSKSLSFIGKIHALKCITPNNIDGVISTKACTLMEVDDKYVKKRIIKKDCVCYFEGNLIHIDYIHDYSISGTSLSSGERLEFTLDGFYNWYNIRTECLSVLFDSLDDYKRRYNLGLKIEELYSISLKNLL